MKPMDLPRDNFSGVKPLDVVVGNMSGMKPVGNSDVKPIDLRDNNNAAVLNGEAMNNVMSKLIGLDKIAPNFNLSKTVNNPKYDNSKPENNTMPMNKNPDVNQNANINSQNNKKVDEKSIKDKNTQNPVSKDINTFENLGKTLRNDMMKEMAKL